MKAVVITPKNLLTTWLADYNKFLNEKRRIKLYHFPLSPKDRDRYYKQYRKVKNGHLLLMTYETYREFWPKIKKERQFKILVKEESHKYKSLTCKTNLMIGETDVVQKIFLSATPAANINQCLDLMTITDPVEFKNLKTLHESIIEEHRTSLQRLLHQALQYYSLKNNLDTILKLPTRSHYIGIFHLAKQQKQELKKMMNGNSEYYERAYIIAGATMPECKTAEKMADYSPKLAFIAKVIEQNPKRRSIIFARYKSTARYARDGLSCIFPEKNIGLLTSEENMKRTDRQQLQFLIDAQTGKYDIVVMTWVRNSSSNINNYSESNERDTTMINEEFSQFRVWLLWAESTEVQPHL